ncbi:hypothetical protein KJ586_00715 [Patescibacteria group bacterium]|nr:hypothetical protein [Patescibacteria group bacterium]MBU4347518.1 hypothetical protein [Patescibacteria group bacterium]MBU4455020.1 hypothetical protein [Patescibacteria group bacterium]MCG2690801.1 hypothetical protein [Candidatus Parcubacteria bacterium]
MMKEKLQKISKFIISRMFYLILGICIAVAIPVAYAAWNTFVNPGETLTATKWNEHVNKLVELDNKVNSIAEIGVYRCPIGCAGCSGGAWGFYECTGQITTKSNCATIEYPCAVTCSCTYIGKMRVY